MKYRILLIASFLIFSKHGFSQNQVFLNIHHHLGEDPFSLNTPSTNNLGHPFDVSRLEYYVSGISIIHDGGTATTIDSLWILVNATTPVVADLGTHAIDEVEAIHFYIGVDPDHNHLDPASFDPSHPLAPKNPSMHWGWVSGYRFVAFEGNGGPQYNQSIQLHGLGDQNYIKTRVNVSALPQDQRIDIHLDADYARVIEDISVNTGIIVHGEGLEAQQALENFRNFVFSPSDVQTSVTGHTFINRFDVYPNPAVNGESTICIDAESEHTYGIRITDALGKQIALHKEVTPGISLFIKWNNPGIYFIQLLVDGQPSMSRKVISK
jgi:hypothetical protein